MKFKHIQVRKTLFEMQSIEYIENKQSIFNQQLKYGYSAESENTAVVRSIFPTTCKLLYLNIVSSMANHSYQPEKHGSTSKTEHIRSSKNALLFTMLMSD